MIIVNRPQTKGPHIFQKYLHLSSTHVVCIYMLSDIHTYYNIRLLGHSLLWLGH